MFTVGQGVHEKTEKGVDLPLLARQSVPQA
jgi:hypothetical protein